MCTKFSVRDTVVVIPLFLVRSSPRSVPRRPTRALPGLGFGREGLVGARTKAGSEHFGGLNVSKHTLYKTAPRTSIMVRV